MKIKRRTQNAKCRTGERNLAIALFCILVPEIASAKPTQEEVFKQISQNMGESADTGVLLLVLLLATMLTVTLVLLGQRRRNQAAPKALNHPRKLLKEVVRQLDVKPREMRKLKALAQSAGYTSPLTLMLCPSLLKAQIKNKSEDENSPSAVP